MQSPHQVDIKNVVKCWKNSFRSRISQYSASKKGTYLVANLKIKTRVPKLKA